MKSKLSFLATVFSGFVTSVGTAFAAPGAPGVVPEPGSLALVGLAIGVLVAVSRRGRK